MRNTTSGWCIWVCVLLLVPCVAQAKAPCDKSDPACKEAFDVDPDSADGEGALLSNRGRITLSLGDNEKTGSASFGWGSLGHKLSLKLSAPVDDSSKSAEFLNFEGLNGASNLKFEYNYIDWSRIDFGKIRAAGITPPMLLSARTAYCAVHLKALAEVPDTAKAEAKWSSVREVHERLVEVVPLPDTSTVAKYFELGPRVNSLPEDRQNEYSTVRILEDWAGAQAPPCDQATWKSISTFFKTAQKEGVKKRGRWLHQQIDAIGNKEDLAAAVVALKKGGLTRAEFLESRWNRFVGGAATIGYKKFDFFDRDVLGSTGELKKANDREKPWSLGIQAGWVRVSDDPDKGDEAVIVSLTNEESYKAADEIEHCKPVEGFESVSGIQTCESASLGPPTEKDALKIGIEWRTKHKKYAWATRGFYRDIAGKGKDYGFEVPVYFARDKDDKFTGGVRFSWTDDAKEGIAIFVGKPFKVNPN